MNKTHNKTITALHAQISNLILYTKLKERQKRKGKKKKTPQSISGNSRRWLDFST